MTEQQIITVQELSFYQQIIAFLKVWMWEVIGVLVAPLAATRMTNILKAGKRMIARQPWHPSIWHTITWMLAFGFSFYAFSFKYEQAEAIAFVSFLLASFNSAIVEGMYKRASRNDTAQAMFNKILYVQPDDMTLVVKAGALASGMTVMMDKRKEARDEHDPTRAMSEKERAEITNRP